MSPLACHGSLIKARTGCGRSTSYVKFATRRHQQPPILLVGTDNQRTHHRGFKKSLAMDITLVCIYTRFLTPSLVKSRLCTTQVYSPLMSPSIYIDINDPPCLASSSSIILSTSRSGRSNILFRLCAKSKKKASQRPRLRLDILSDHVLTDLFDGLVITYLDPRYGFRRNSKLPVKIG